MAHSEHATAQAAVAPQLDPCPADPPPEGFEHFFRTAWRPLIRTALAYGATPSEAEDAVADALAYMLPRWPIADSPMAYACKVTLSNFFKARSRGDTRVIRRLVERGHVPNRESAEDGHLTDLEDIQWVTGVLRQLTPAQQEVLALAAYGYSYREIAEHIKKSKEAVRKRVSDARARLRKILTPDGEFRQSDNEKGRDSGEEAR